MSDEKQGGTCQDVAWYRMEQSLDDLDTAKLLLREKKYRAANNRAYYACFHAMNALLALSSIAFKRHKDVIAYFNRYYVHENVFPREFGGMVGRLQMIRTKSDYDDMYVADKEESTDQVEIAEKIILAISEYIKEKV
ncbi:MAG: HEPN domain-containing protein [Lachnospiraceae bacterium]|nr:HEPN domain-containing protein [Lachnospiraceae bacterium]